MSSDDSFDALMDRLRRGDEQAAQQVFQRFGERLIGLAQSRLNAAMRQKLDPEDVTQSVFRSFFRGQAEGRFDLDSWDSLWSLLTLITLRKCGHKVKYFRAARRDILREARPAPAEDPSAWKAIAREPTPFEAAVLAETLEQTLRGLNGHQRHIVELSLEGYTVPEISASTGRAERSVYRLLEQVKKKLQQLSDDGGES
jgi:RNA polymerase sigma-70 factor (ECF subfamily)